MIDINNLDFDTIKKVKWDKELGEIIILHTDDVVDTFATTLDVYKSVSGKLLAHKRKLKKKAEKADNISEVATQEPVPPKRGSRKFRPSRSLALTPRRGLDIEIYFFRPDPDRILEKQNEGYEMLHKNDIEETLPKGCYENPANPESSSIIIKGMIAMKLDAELSVQKQKYNQSRELTSSLKDTKQQGNFPNAKGYELFEG